MHDNLFYIKIKKNENIRIRHEMLSKYGLEFVLR